MSFKNLEEKTIQIGSINKKVLYNVINELPSEKRLYPDIGKVYVRGLFYGEVLEASKINDDSLESTIKLYSDAIKFENPNYTLEDLELVDFILLTSIVNIMTTPDFKWYPDFKCSNIIENPKLKKLKLDLEDLKYDLEDLEELYNNAEDEVEKEKISKSINNIKDKIKELEEKINNFDEDEYVECGARVTTPISFDDLVIYVVDPNITVPEYYNFEGVELELKPLTVKDYIELEKATDLNENLAILAKHIKNIKFEDAYNLIKMSSPWEIENLSEFIERFSIEIKPIKTRCLRCGKEYELYIDLKDIKVLP